MFFAVREGFTEIIFKHNLVKVGEVVFFVLVLTLDHIILGPQSLCRVVIEVYAIYNSENVEYLVKFLLKAVLSKVFEVDFKEFVDENMNIFETLFLVEVKDPCIGDTAVGTVNYIVNY